MHVCLCVRARMYVCAFGLYALNFENLCILRMCKSLGPVQVGCFNYPLLLLLYTMRVNVI